MYEMTQFAKDLVARLIETKVVLQEENKTLKQRIHDLEDKVTKYEEEHAKV